jgi:hypothetical protein
MPSNAIRRPAKEDDHQSRHELDRWRTAVDIVRRLREAGIECELNTSGARN